MPETRNGVLIPLADPREGVEALAALRRFLVPDRSKLILLHVAGRSRAATFAARAKTRRILAESRARGLPRRSSGVGPISSTMEPLADEVEGRVGAPAQAEESERLRIVRAFDGLVRELEDAGYAASVKVRFGHVVDEIVRTSDAEGVDLLVMARRGTAGLARAMSRRTTEQVLRRVSTPVLVVHTPWRHRWRRKVRPFFS